MQTHRFINDPVVFSLRGFKCTYIDYRNMGMQANIINLIENFKNSMARDPSPNSQWIYFWNIFPFMAPVY